MARRRRDLQCRGAVPRVVATGRSLTMDMLIKLYAPPARPAADLAAVRKPIGPEHAAITGWVAIRFGPGWASEAQVALSNQIGRAHV